MKKLLASLLAIVMALSLALPAFAAGASAAIPAPDGYPPVGWTADVERAELAKELGIPTAEDYELSDDTWEWITNHPEETKEFLTSGIDGYLQRMGGASIEDLYGDWLSPEGGALILLETWVWTQYDPASDMTPPLWQVWGYESYEEMLASSSWTPAGYAGMVSYAIDFMETRPEETAQLRANVYDYFAQEYDSYGSPQDYMDYWNQSEEDFILEMMVWQMLDIREAEERQAELDAFDAKHPGMIARFEANAYNYFAQEYDYWDSAEEYMELYGYTEEEFVAEMVEEQIYNLLYKEEQQELLDQMKAEMGGVPGQVGVMIDGSYVQFPDAVPELTGGRTMVPLRAIMEALGAEVTYNGNDDIRCTVNGVQYAFAVGSNAVKLRYVEWDGEGDAPDMEGLEMDCAPYIKNGRTYVPVRFFAEAFGYTVGWDGDFKTAVIFDPAALAAEIDKDFTILNRAQAGQLIQLEEGQSLQSELTGEMTFTSFDTLNGNTDYHAGFTGESLSNAEAISGSASLSLSDTVLGLLEELPAGVSQLPEEDAAALRAALKEAELRFILSADGKAWLRTSLMSLMGTGAADAWYRLDLSGLDADTLGAMFAGTQAVTMGQAAAASADPNSALSWSLRVSQFQQAAELLGDSRFTRVNGVDTLTIGPEQLGMDEEDLGAFKDFSMTVTVDSQGQTAVSLLIHTLPQRLGDASMRLTMDGSSARGKSVLTCRLHIANVGELNMSVTVTQQPSSQSPMTRPPAGDTVVESLVTP